MCGGGALLCLQPYKPHLAAGRQPFLLCLGVQMGGKSDRDRNKAAGSSLAGTLGQGRAGGRSERAEEGCRAAALDPVSGRGPSAPMAGDPHPLWADTSRTSSPSVLGGE